MSTPRKRWFRVADSVRRDTLGNDELAFMVRLMAEMNTRWARDGLSTEECSTIVLSPGDFIALTGSASLVRARRIAQRLSVDVSLTVDALGANTRINWPKYAEFQHPAPPSEGKHGATADPGNAASASASASAPSTPKKEKESVASLPSPASPISEGKGNKPENFSPDQMAAIRVWASGKGFPNSTLNEAMERFREWEPLKNSRRTQKQWISSFQHICREAVEDGKIGKPKGEDLKPKGPAYVEFRGYDEQGNRR